MIRICTNDDLKELLRIGELFCNESQWGWKYSKENALRTFYTAINHPETDIIGAFDGDKMVGVAIVATENDFTEDTLGDIIEFYVSPEARGTGVSRDLLGFMCDWFDGRNCADVFVKSTGNIDGQSKAFENLFSKFGFNVFSNVLVRKKNV